MTDVVCIGECMIELRERPDGLLSRGFGGDTLNTAIYLARLGVGVDYFTVLGDDPFSDAMVAAWQAEGVGVENVLRVSGELPGIYLIRTDLCGERRFSYWRQAAPVRRMFALPDFSRLAAAISNYRLIYLSGITLSLFEPADRRILFELLDGARTKGARVVFDTNFRPGGWADLAVARSAYEDMLERSDLVLASVEDCALLNDEPHAPANEWIGAAQSWLSKAMRRELVLRSNDLDCRLFLEGREARASGEPAPVVIDTTAAGDSFAAAYIAARLRGTAPEQSAKEGHRLARVVVAHAGAIVPRAVVSRFGASCG